MLRRIAMFVLCLAAWILLVWPFGDRSDGPIGWPDIAVGTVAALAVAVIMRERETPPLRLRPGRIFWLLVYALVLAWYVLKANLDVAYRVLHPDMPIRPGIVKVRTSLRSAAALTALANSITLTPGTLTVNVLDDGTLYVHWINVTAVDVDEATSIIVSRFEWFVKRIFE